MLPTSIICSVSIYYLEPMIFNEYAQFLDQLEREPSRLGMTRILADLFAKLSFDEARVVAYFCTGILNPPYTNIQIGLADKSVVKVVAQLGSMTPERVQQNVDHAVDIGEVVAHMQWESLAELSINQVYNALIALAQQTGTGSQDAKIQGLADLLQQVSPLSAKFIVRIVLGTLRLGFSDMTIIDALSWLLVGDKSLSGIIEDAYNVCADIGYIASTVKKQGIEGIKNIQILVGVPIMPAAAERLSSAQEIITKIGPCIAEPKLDGFRLQVHIDNRQAEKKVSFFSRNLLDMSAMYPDLVCALEGLDVKTFIAEGEAIAFDPNTGSFMPFQETVKRKRKHDIAVKTQEIPLQLFFFDILYLDGQSLMPLSMVERRAKLVKLLAKSSINTQVIHVTQEKNISDARELENYFLEQVAAGLEGVVVKRPDVPYQPGKRNFNWIKLKRLASGHLLDSVDVVVLGYYYGSGKRAAFGIGAILVGVYNKLCDCFQTVAKVGTGFSDHEWQHIKKQCDMLVSSAQPKNVDCHKDLAPDVWVKPEMVLEITADEITRSPLHSAARTSDQPGFALRFPRFERYRSDKTAYETTTVQELLTLYKKQQETKN